MLSTKGCIEKTIKKGEIEHFYNDVGLTLHYHCTEGMGEMRQEMWQTRDGLYNIQFQAYLGCVFSKEFT